MASDDDVRGIGEGPPIQVRHAARVAHGLGPRQFGPVPEVINYREDGEDEAVDVDVGQILRRLIDPVLALSFPVDKWVTEVALSTHL